MTPVNAANRAFFTDCILKKSDSKELAETVPISAFSAAAKELKDAEAASKFLAGHIHWLRAKRPRTLEQAVDVAASNIGYCFEDGLSKELWEKVLLEAKEEALKSSKDDAAEVFQKNALIGEQIKEGKDPTVVSALAQKVLLKKKKQ